MSMSKAKPTSISRKLIWMNMLVSGAVLLLACAALMAYDLITLRDTVVRNLSTQAAIIGSNSVSALVFNDESSAQHTLVPLNDPRNIVSAVMYSTDGQPFAGYQRNFGSARISLPPIPANQIQVSL